MINLKNMNIAYLKYKGKGQINLIEKVKKKKKKVAQENIYDQHYKMILVLKKQSQKGEKQQ